MPLSPGGTIPLLVSLPELKRTDTLPFLLPLILGTSRFILVSRPPQSYHGQANVPPPHPSIRKHFPSAASSRLNNCQHVFAVTTLNLPPLLFPLYSTGKFPLSRYTQCRHPLYSGLGEIAFFSFFQPPNPALLSVHTEFLDCPSLNTHCPSLS